MRGSAELYTVSRRRGLDSEQWTVEREASEIAAWRQEDGGWSSERKAVRDGGQAEGEEGEQGDGGVAGGSWVKSGRGSGRQAAQ